MDKIDWDENGFLENLDENSVAECEKCLNETVQYLEQQGRDVHEDFRILSLIYRIFLDVGTFGDTFSPEYILNFFDTNLENAERNNMMVDEEEDLNLLVDILDEDKINNFLANDFIYNDNDIWVKSQCECNDMCSDWFEIS